MMWAILHAAFRLTSTYLLVSFEICQRRLRQSVVAEAMSLILPVRLAPCSRCRRKVGALSRPYARQWPGAHVAVATAGRRYLRKDANPDPAAARAQRLRVASRLSRGTSAGRIFADCAWRFVERAHHHARPLGRKPSSRHRTGAARIRPTRRMMAARIRCLAVGRQPGRPHSVPASGRIARMVRKRQVGIDLRLTMENARRASRLRDSD